AAENGKFRVWVKLDKLEHYQYQEAYAAVIQELKVLGYVVELRNSAPNESVFTTVADVTYIFQLVSWE
ncbi:hypothetical protein, partial [Oenococcus oeni]|uniref:hypothetical protein n=1 Tax=Oenococcus oeni TaxID=1247 RepID=UPI001C5B79DA